MGTPTQIIIEKGYVGFFIWSFFLLTISLLIIKEKRIRILHIIIISTFLSLLLRELFFPVFFNSFLLMFLTFLLLAVLQHDLKGIKRLYISRIMITLPPLIGLLILIKSLFVNYDNINNKKSLYAYFQKDYKKSLFYINKTSQKTPYLINKAIICKSLYNDTQDKKFLRYSEQALYKAMENNPYDPHIKNYLAEVFIQNFKYDSAFIIMNHLVEKYPNNHIFRYNLSIALLKKNDLYNSELNLIKAIQLYPDLLKLRTPEINHIYGSLISNIRESLNFNDKKTDTLFTPIQLSKYGKIFLIIGDTNYANLYLNMAVDKMPALSQPWLNLSIINQNSNIELSELYAKRYLVNSIGIKALRNNSLIQQDSIYSIANNDESISIVNSNYKAQFISWYNTYLINL